MNILMLGGLILAGIGVLISMLTAKWSWKLGGFYRSNNKPLTLIGWICIILGFGLFLFIAYINGQLG